MPNRILERVIDVVAAHASTSTERQTPSRFETRPMGGTAQNVSQSETSTRSSSTYYSSLSATSPSREPLSANYDANLAYNINEKRSFSSSEASNDSKTPIIYQPPPGPPPPGPPPMTQQPYGTIPVTGTSQNPLARPPSPTSSVAPPAYCEVEDVEGGTDLHDPMTSEPTHISSGPSYQMPIPQAQGSFFSPITTANTQPFRPGPSPSHSPYVQQSSNYMPHPQSNYLQSSTMNYPAPSSSQPTFAPSYPAPGSNYIPSSLSSSPAPHASYGGFSNPLVPHANCGQPPTSNPPALHASYARAAGFQSHRAARHHERREAKLAQRLGCEHEQGGRGRRGLIGSLIEEVVRM